MKAIMRNLILLSVCFLQICLPSSGEQISETVTDFADEAQVTSIVPINILVCSINDLRVKEGQTIKIGQILALKPIEPEAPQGYISQKADREVLKQKEKLAAIQKVVQENDLPNIIVTHEQAKLKDLEFEAKEFKLGAISPKAPKETIYKSPINGKVKRITAMNGSDGKLNVEILVEKV